MLPFGKVDPKKMQEMMERFGIKSKDVPAKEVIIKGEKDIVIKNPQVTEIDFSGQKTFQVIGDITVQDAKSHKGSTEGEELDISRDDIKLVAERAKVSEAKAKAALEKTKGDIVKAIILLKKD